MHAFLKFGATRQQTTLLAFFLVLSCTLVSAEVTVPGNLQINGSFEYATNPDIPDYWSGTGRFYRSNGLPAEWCDADGLKEFREKFRLDNRTAYHGSNSMCIQRPFHLLGMPMACPTGAAYTVSLYLKGEFPNRQVKLGVTDRDTLSLAAEKVVSVSQEWTRHELHLEQYPHSNISLWVVPLDSGRVWIDAVQMEMGTKAGPFKPSPYDVGFTLPQPVVHPRPGSDSIPELRLGPPTTATPIIDGIANDPVWTNAPAVSMNDYMGVPATVATQVKVAYDKTHLYLSFTCADPGQARGLGDSIEILIDVLGIGDPFYQFVFDARGGKHNYRSLRGIHDWTWKADWQVATRLADGQWTAEAAIPFASFPDAVTMANLHTLRMNLCRNYAPGPEKYLSWAPVAVGFLEPQRFGRVILGSDTEPLVIPAIDLAVSDAADSLFTLNFTALNHTPDPHPVIAVIALEEQGQAVQVRTVSFELQPGKPQPVAVPGFKIEGLRCRTTILFSDRNGDTLKQVRTFIDVPHPMRIYPEYSYYTTEKDARIVVEFRNTHPLPKDSRLALVLRVAGYPRPLVEKTFASESEGGRQIVPVPVGPLEAGHIYDVDARVLDAAGSTLMQASAKLFKHEPNRPEVKINRINRGVYLNGEPYIPYGILTAYFDLKQLRYYRQSGFDFISFISHWHSPEKGIEFLENCESVGLNAVAFHVARPGRISPPDAAKVYRRCQSLIGFTPNDEESDRQVYDIADRMKLAYPQILTCINHNFTSYRAFANRLDGFPGDVLSIDRYPLLALPNGRPHTISEIYSVERCAEMMDRDGNRERMPLFFWLQAGERFSKEPTPRELTWLTYILLVNHCTGFTYFGGMPSSQYAWTRMISLNKEIQELKPYLFSFEAEPEIGFGNADSTNYIRVLPKVVGKELVLICVNRAMTPIDAALNLSHSGRVGPGSAAVLFEKRAVPIGNDGILRDRFEPLSRHVYKVGLQ